MPLHVKQPWRIWVNVYGSTWIDNRTSAKQSFTNPCTYFVGCNFCYDKCRSICNPHWAATVTSDFIIIDVKIAVFINHNGYMQYQFLSHRFRFATSCVYLMSNMMDKWIHILQYGKNTDSNIKWAFISLSYVILHGGFFDIIWLRYLRQKQCQNEKDTKTPPAFPFHCWCSFFGWILRGCGAMCYLGNSSYPSGASLVLVLSWPLTPVRLFPNKYYFIWGDGKISSIWTTIWDKLC